MPTLPSPISPAAESGAATGPQGAAFATSGAGDSGGPLLVIGPGGGSAGAWLREFWAARELVYFLAWRDIKVRYKQTALGAAWALLQPLLTMGIFTVFFGRLAGVPSDGVPYPLFSLAALVPWTFFAYGLGQAANSVVLNQPLVTKVYFPRLAIPVATVLAGVADFLIAFALLLVFMAWYGALPTANALWVLPLSVLTVVTALAVGLWLAALNVLYRDVRHTVPFLTQAWLLATPIAYPSSLLPPEWRAVYGLNPMAGVVEGFRWALLGTPAPDAGMLLVSAGAALVLLFSGVAYFRRMESTFADVI